MPLYFEDIAVGFTYTTPKRSVFETDIVNFVALAGMYDDLSCNLEYIEHESVFKGRFAPAALTWALAQGLTTRTGLYDKTFLAILGVDRMRFVQPVRIGYTLHVEAEVLSRRETSKGDRGVLNSLF